MDISHSPSRIEVSVIVPMHNEISVVRRCIENVRDCLGSLSSPYEMVIAEDGSTDGTRELIDQIKKNNSRIRCTCSKVRLGKGLALTNAIKLTRGNIAAIVDADMTDDVDCLKDLIKKGEEVDGLVLGSRVLGGVADNRPILRRITSKLYNLVVRLLFRDNIRDHQCGFKALSRSLIDALVPHLREKGFAWDTEVIALTRKLGYPVHEIPIVTVERRNGLKSKVNLLKDGLCMVMSLLLVRYRLLRAPKRRS
jgi:glycosyltransferase involved in cell wall biosynthesis